MARYVLVEFDDNAAAHRFIEKVNGHYGSVLGNYMARRAIGSWGKPTLFCECTSFAKGMRPFTRSNKSGWWVCAMCRRPTRAWGEAHSHWASALGRNLLPGNKDPQPRGWGLLGDDKFVAPTPTGDHEPDPALLRKAERRSVKSSQRKLNPRRVSGHLSGLDSSDMES